MGKSDEQGMTPPAPAAQETPTPETNAFTLTLPTYQQCYDRLRDLERSRDALLARLAEAERERDELQVAASLSTEYRHKYHEALRERDSEHAARVAAERERDEARRGLAAVAHFVDEVNGVDFHEQAALHATVHGRDEPNTEDYASAVMDALREDESHG